LTLHAAVARRRLGGARWGEGARVVAEVDALLAAQDLRAPERYARLYLPEVTSRSSFVRPAQNAVPTHAVKSDTPWLEDDAIARKLIGVLEGPVNFLFYLASRSGLAVARAAGLRVSDQWFIDEGMHHPRSVLVRRLAQGRQEGRGQGEEEPAPEDCVEFIEQCWEHAVPALVGSKTVTIKGEGHRVVDALELSCRDRIRGDDEQIHQHP
jgi:hypothetical protein